jgi:carbon-monoxide dehydrogenase large subunit/6-hydroxypseudooxynicotine dehydrogenase subunit gamma
VWVRGAPGRSLTFEQLAVPARVPAAVVALAPVDAPAAPAVAALAHVGMPAASADEPLIAAHRYDASQMTYPYGAHVAVVEVDAETGQIRLLDYAIAYDVGRAVNPMLVKGQLVGGLAQGIGGALLEEFVYADDGQPLSSTFMDYLVPTAAEMPRRVAVRILEETPTPLNPLGVKGAGEGGTAAAGAAIANAVADALRPMGVEITDLPLSPDRILRLMSEPHSRSHG